MRGKHRQVLSLSLALSFVLALALSSGLHGAEPGAELEEDAIANFGAISAYQVALDQEVEFLSAVVHSGGYAGLQPGFCNERIVRGEDNGDGTVNYYVMTRYMNEPSMRRTRVERASVVMPYLKSHPVQLNMDLQEHQLPNWGWERNSNVAFARLGGEGPTDMAKTLDEYGTSLTFFKYGYTGQAAMVRTYPEGMSVTDIRRELTAIDGLAGASIFKNTGDDGGHIVYAEFFETPGKLKKQTMKLTADGLRGTGVGVVVQNYRAR